MSCDLLNLQANIFYLLFLDYFTREALETNLNRSDVSIDLCLISDFKRGPIL